MPNEIIQADVELITLKQLPIIEERLTSVRALVENRIQAALDLDCTEDNYKEIKKVRSELNREKSDLESRRKFIKASIMAPYDQFEATYKECVGNLYDEADRALASKIGAVETGIKKRKEDAIRRWFNEYRQSTGVSADFADFDRAGIKIGMSSTMKSMQDASKSFIDRVCSDLLMIETQEHADEILVEYKKTLSVQDAVVMVAARHKAIEEAQRKRQEQAEIDIQRAEMEKVVEDAISSESPAEVPLCAPVMAPVVAPVEEEPVKDEKMYKVTFTVTASLAMMKELKKFLEEGGYTYE